MRATIRRSRPTIASLRGLAVLVSAGVTLALLGSCDSPAGVDPAPSPLRIAPDSVHFDALAQQVALAASLSDGSGGTVPAAAVAWSVADPAIATVDPQGTLVSISVGSTQVTARVDSLVASIPVVVAQVARSITIEPSAWELESVGDTLRFSVSGIDAQGYAIDDLVVDWSADPSGIVSVDSQGLVTGVGFGSARVVATGAATSAEAVVTLQAPAVRPPDLSGLLVSYRVDLARVGPDPDTFIRVTNTPAWEDSPRFSADGSQVAYRRRDSGTGDWAPWIMNPDGTGQTQLSTRRVLRFAPSPDGSRVAFSSSGGTLFVVDADGGNELALIGNAAAGLPGILEGQVSASVHWSPDGQWISFWGGVLEPKVGGILLVRPDGSEVRTITSGGSTSSGAPSGSVYDWSPDGSRVVFQCGGGELCVVNADGSGERQLTNNVGSQLSDWGPKWSPDGSRIATIADRNTSYWAIAVLDAADGRTLATFGGDRADRQAPVWSPDSRWIAYGDNRWGGLYVSPSDGSSRPYVLGLASPGDWAR